MTQYYVTRGTSGDIVGLSRIVRTPNALRGEALRDGKWVNWPGLLSRLFDNDPRDEVSEEEAAAIVKRLGGSL